MVLPDRQDSRWIHAALLLALIALFVWLFLRFFVTPLYIAESDLYEDGLPIFLSPIWVWSSYEFSGLPAFADPADFTFYPLRILFGTIVHSWTALVMTGPLLAALLTYAYLYAHTRSKTAALYSALAYGLSEEMLERLRHFNHVHVIAWLPLIALAIDRVDFDLQTTVDEVLDLVGREDLRRRRVAHGDLALRGGAALVFGFSGHAVMIEERTGGSRQRLRQLAPAGDQFGRMVQIRQ